MKTFYVQNGVPDNTDGQPDERTFIDERLHAGCEVVKVIEAETWRDARDQTGWV
jgi:hypothetical protein